MKAFRWNPQKNEELKATRNVSFEQLLSARFIDFDIHPRKPHQRFMIFEYKNYVWAVPFVEDGHCYFLKTAFPNRKYTKKYLGGKEDEKDQTDS